MRVKQKGHELNTIWSKHLLFAYSLVGVFFMLFIGAFILYRVTYQGKENEKLEALKTQRGELLKERTEITKTLNKLRTENVELKRFYTEALKRYEETPDHDNYEDALFDFYGVSNSPRRDN